MLTLPFHLKTASYSPQHGDEGGCPLSLYCKFNIEIVCYLASDDEIYHSNKTMKW